MSIIFKFIQISAFLFHLIWKEMEDYDRLSLRKFQHPSFHAMPPRAVPPRVLFAIAPTVNKYNCVNIIPNIIYLFVIRNLDYKVDSNYSREQRFLQMPYGRG